MLCDGASLLLDLLRARIARVGVLAQARRIDRPVRPLTALAPNHVCQHCAVPVTSKECFGQPDVELQQHRVCLADELLKRAPSSLGRVLFSSSGTEAIEAAIKIGRAATSRTGVVSVERGFHGLTLGALSASGDAAFSGG